MLLLLNTKIKTLHKEKSDLEIKLAEAEIKSVEANETMKVLQKNLILAKDELIKLNKTELYNIAAQTTSDTLAKEIDILKTNFAEKDNQLRLSKIEIDKININHETELINLEKKFQSEFQAFKEKR